MKLIIIFTILVSNSSFASSNSGEKAFAVNCSSCHGLDGKAQTDIGKALKARNFTADEFKQIKDKKKGLTENDIFETLKTGVPGTGMASFSHLPEADRKAIAHYVFSLRKKSKK